ncbi:unnamed protein product [Caenorhabditis angaria]|uniref:Uncharacterized protein n=1 Tax=Caenorhabditis angaria TaxID=860376 RepID=A0A9P1NCJ5_9PELO|nr:unnamed protein product [Caenorhabditis angaria]
MKLLIICIAMALFLCDFADAKLIGKSDSESENSNEYWCGTARLRKLEEERRALNDALQKFHEKSMG